VAPLVVGRRRVTAQVSRSVACAGGAMPAGSSPSTFSAPCAVPASGVAARTCATRPARASALLPAGALPAPSQRRVAIRSARSPRGKCSWCRGAPIHPGCVRRFSVSAVYVSSVRSRSFGGESPGGLAHFGRAAVNVYCGALASACMRVPELTATPAAMLSVVCRARPSDFAASTTPWRAMSARTRRCRSVEAGCLPLVGSEIAFAIVA
jgi:hypothetical protein